MRGRGRGRGRGRKSNVAGQERSSENNQLAFDNYEDPLDFDESVKVKNEVFVDEIMPECEVFGMMSSQDLLEEQRRTQRGMIAIDERNINERLGSLERKVDFLINLHVKILARVDKLCEDAKEVVEPTEFPIKSKEELEIMDEKIANAPDKYIELFKVLFKPDGFEKHICRIFNDEMVIEMNFDGACSKLGLTNYANLNSALFESLKREGFTYGDYRKTVRAAFNKTKNRIYKSWTRRRQAKSAPAPAKRAMTPKEDSATCDEGEDESYENPEYKTTSKKRSIEKSTPKPAKRVMVEKEKSPPALEDADEFEVDRFEDSSPMDFVKANLDILEDDYEPEMSAELEELTVDFPIKDKSQLEAVEKKISSNREKYVRLFKFYLKSGSFEENCASFFDGSLAVDMSYDGLGSKTAFSNYVHFNIALFESQKSDEFTYEDYKKTVRSGFLKYKKWKRNDRKK
ncbi:uncharacterized protein LOC133840693 isoform X1 [Drosophila sulfurigaster albostrigata]|uniref:uncharacterized protein LOC133840693 isoform X1 n=1 Tax=Drosophila sulfurigaster albostrigata TaxID=89887 RepID=UPI002D21B74A|nr:uncharacterized protein LOC133840693 isoform X1 [Drosophila sulfurigaster albostrigata]XP_062128644.1 uncharacterized protein LOC133840693 isoform X1 [Drosophila sulfurigaster albostrigata]